MTNANETCGGATSGKYWRRFLAVGLLACIAALTSGFGTAHAQTRSLKLYYLHTKEKAEIVYKVNGRYDEAGLKKINHFLRDWRRNEPTKMDPHLLDLLWEVYRMSGSRDYIHVVSAYRSPATNSMLRKRSSGVAKNSQHTLGKAMDFFLPDVPLEKLREIGLKAGVGGVGYYPTSGSPFVHMDTGSVRHWPRMTRQQLVKIFPDGKTMHVPSDGKPLPGYDQALAAYKARRAGTSALTVAAARDFSRPGFFKGWSRKQNEAQEDDDVEDADASGVNVAVMMSATDKGQSPARARPTAKPAARIAARPAESAPEAAPADDLPQMAVEEQPQLAQNPEEALADALALLDAIPIPQQRPALANMADSALPVSPSPEIKPEPATTVAALTPDEIERIRRTAVTPAIPPAPVQRLAAMEIPPQRESLGMAPRPAPRPVSEIPSASAYAASAIAVSPLPSSAVAMVQEGFGRAMPEPQAAPKSPNEVPAAGITIPKPRPTPPAAEKTPALAAAPQPDTRETLELALAEPAAGNSASKAIRDLIDSRHATEPAPQTGTLAIAATPAPLPAPLETAYSIPGKWALAAHTPLSMISEIRAPVRGHTHYTHIERNWATTQFMTRGPLQSWYGFEHLAQAAGITHLAYRSN